MPKDRKEKKRRSGEKGAFSATVWPLILSFLFTMALGVLLLLCACALLLRLKDPAPYQKGVALALLYLSAFFGGVFITRRTEKKAPLFFSFALGALLLIVMGGMTAILPKEWGSSPSLTEAALTRLAVLPACILGAIAAARKKDKRKRHR